MNKNKFKSWIQTHKSELIIVGSTIVATIGTILLIENWETVKGVDVKSVEDYACQKNETVDNEKLFSTIISPVENKLVDVSEHLRKLPIGQKPSLEKIEEAAVLEIILPENYTLVSPYQRRLCA